MADIKRKDLEKTNKDQLIELAAGMKDSDDNGLILDLEMLKNAMIEAILIRAEDVAEKTDAPAIPPPPEKTSAGSLQEQLAASEARADAAESEAAASKEQLEAIKGNKIPNAIKTDSKIPRPAELMNKQVASAAGVKPEELDEDQKTGIECNIREYVKKGYNVVGNKRQDVGGGFKAGISDRKKARARTLLKMIGRVDDKGEPILEWDESIIVPGYH